MSLQSSTVWAGWYGGVILGRQQEPPKELLLADGK